jgi:NhaA family Na+:H+ antiporter
MGWTSLLGYAWLAGIGLTMSLFIAMLALDETAPVTAAKLGILAGSLLAGIAGAIVLKVAAAFRNDH